MVDIGAIFTQSFTLLWRRKFLWLLGFCMGVNGLAFSLGRLFLRPLLPDAWFETEFWLDWLQGSSFALSAGGLEPAQLRQYLLIGLGVMFVYVVLFWVIVTVAEGSLIGAAIEEAAGRTAVFSRSLRMGLGYLARFAAIDAAVFLPLFLWILFLFTVALIDSFLVGYLTLQTETETQTVVAVFALGWLCVLGLSCLILPITLASIWYRTLAFRDAAVLDHGVRTAVRHPRQVIRAHGGELIALTAFLYGINYLLGWMLGLLALPLLALTAVPLAAGFTSTAGLLAGGANLLMALVVALLKGIVHTFTAVAWTLAYREMVVDSPPSVAVAEEVS